MLWSERGRASMQELYNRGKLNKSQSQAIAASITRTFSIWQGPPGTGKTNTLVGLMRVRPPRCNALPPPSPPLVPH